MLLNQTAFGRLVGVSQQAISAKIKEGFLVYEPGTKKLDKEKSLDRLRKLGQLDANGQLLNAKKDDKKKPKAEPSLDFSNPGYKTVADLTPEEKKAREEQERLKFLAELEKIKLEAKEEDIELGDLSDFSNTSLSDIKDIEKLEIIALRKLEILIKVKLQTLQYEKEIGQLVPKEEVRGTLRANNRLVKEKLQNLPNKMAAILSGGKSFQECELILQNEVNYILGELSS